MDIAATQDEAEKFLGKFIDIDVNKFHFDIPATADVDSYIKQVTYKISNISCFESGVSVLWK